MRVVIYDGECLMCSKYVRWLLKNDIEEKIRLSTLDSEFHKNICEDTSIDSIIYLKDNNFFYKSSAIIEIIKDLRPIFFLITLLYLIPRPIRDLAYDFVAKKRKNILKNSSKCELLPPKYKDRFLK